VAGFVWYAVTQVARAPSSGSGTIVLLQFQALAEGTSTLALTSVELVDGQGIEIPATPVAGLVQIAPSLLPPAPTRSSTPLQPTHTPGAGDYPEPPADETPTATPAGATFTPRPGQTATPGAYPEASPDGTLTPGTATPEQTSAATPKATRKPTRTGKPTATTDPNATPRPRRTRTTTPSGDATPTPEEPSPAAATPSPSATDDHVPLALLSAVPSPTAATPEVYPLIPQEVFICLAVLLIVFTLLLYLYLTRQRRGASRLKP
jgi:hypothetical protein